MSDLASIYPNRIVKRYVPSAGDWAERYWDRKEASLFKSFENLKIKKRSFALSSQSKSKLRDSIQLLYELSEPRTEFVSSKKSIYNFRASFVTLTLPSRQIHSDIAIKKCLNNFLTRLRGTYKVQNYVWKAELQGNENIHFHLVFDKYISFAAVRYYWNMAINTLGYVDRYADKMKKLDLSQYAAMRGKSVSDCMQAFQKGNQCGWTNPPSENVVAVLSQQQLAQYLSKYLLKGSPLAISKLDPEVQKPKISVTQIARVRNFGRTWARSQSLSKLKVVTRWAWADVLALVSKFDNWQTFFLHKTYDYCEIFYFKFALMPRSLRKIIRRIVVDFGISSGYPFPI